MEKNQHPNAVAKNLRTKSRMHRRNPATKKWSKIHTIIPLLVAVIGVSLLLYPVFATRHNNQVQQEIAQKYEVSMDNKSDAEISAALAKAEKYNENLFEGLILDPFLADAVPDSPDYQAYLSELNLEEVMSRLTVPSIKVNLPVYHGTSDEVLRRGVGHLYGTSLPVGGKGSHAVFTAHTGLTSATLFDNLTKVKKGDAIYLDTYGKRMKYVVYKIEVVKPENTKSLNRVAGRDLITLITCTPYGVNSHRLLVHAERTKYDPAVDDAQADPPINNPWTPWMIGLLILAIVSIATVIWAATHGRKSAHGKKPPRHAAKKPKSPRNKKL